MKGNLISRFDAHATETSGAIVLSVESQVQSLATMTIAPVLSVIVDHMLAQNIGDGFRSIGAVAAFIALLMIVTGKNYIKINFNCDMDDVYSK